MRPLFPILPHQMVGKKLFPLPLGPRMNLFTVGHHPFFSWASPICRGRRAFPSACPPCGCRRGERVPVTGFGREEAECLPGECVERLFRREVRLVTRYARPNRDRKVGRVVVRCTFHQRQCASHIVLHPAEFVPVFRPCDDVAMAAHRLQSIGMRFIQVFVQPLLVYLVTAAVPGKRLHVLRHLLETGKVFVAVIYEYPLVVDMVAGVALRPRGRHSSNGSPSGLSRGVRIARPVLTLSRQVVEVGKGMQAEPLVTDTHSVRIQLHVLQHGRSVGREGKVPFDNARFVLPFPLSLPWSAVPA